MHAPPNTATGAADPATGGAWDGSGTAFCSPAVCGLACGRGLLCGGRGGGGTTTGTGCGAGSVEDAAVVGGTTPVGRAAQSWLLSRNLPPRSPRCRLAGCSLPSPDMASKPRKQTLARTYKLIRTQMQQRHSWQCEHDRPPQELMYLSIPHPLRGAPMFPADDAKPTTEKLTVVAYRKSETDNQISVWISSPPIILDTSSEIARPVNYKIG